VIWTALVLAAVGVFLSAFFSGSETGFYRATRVRLLLDALGGDLVARGLLWLTNHPSLFIATTLVGNNLANYVTSLAIVMGTQAVAGGSGHAMELVVPLMLAPVLFVYGELLPKNLFLQAPNRLLRKGGPLFFGFLVLFFPVSVLLWGLSRILARFVGESPEEVQLTLARRELQRVLEEGHEVGILHRAQRSLAQGIFAAANRPIIKYATSLRDVPRARSGMTKEEILRLARRYRIPAVAVEKADPDRELIGYVRVIDLGLGQAGEVGPLRPFLDIPETATHVAALMQMQNAKQELARVVDTQGRTVGILTAQNLREPIFRGGR